MVKCGAKWDASGVPEWTKLPQYQEQAAKPAGTEQVEMEGIELALEEKLVLRSGLRRKRSRADVSSSMTWPTAITESMNQSMFGSMNESPVKRAKVPVLKQAHTEQIPYVLQSFLRPSAHTCSTVNKLFTVLIKHNTAKNERTKFRVDREKALRSASGFVTAALLDISFSGPMNLTHEDPSLVKDYLTWINTG
jgi:hypothetical protein